MDINKDYYAVLGVTPSAELAVIKAVYKALANKHHPDKNLGNKAQAEAKMREINEAYEVLSDSAKRAAYDAARNKGEEAAFEETEDSFKRAEDTLSQIIQSDWEIAAKYNPSIKTYIPQLTAISRALVLPYKIYILEEQSFSKADEVAEAMVAKYLSTYFGSNEIIVRYAKQLLLNGDREAAKELNKVVRIFGKEIVPSTVIQTIDTEFNTVSSQQEKARGDASHSREHTTDNATEYGSSFFLDFVWMILAAIIFFMVIIVMIALTSG